MTRAAGIATPEAPHLPAPPPRSAWPFDRFETLRVAAMLGVVIALHLAGFGLFAYYNSQPEYRALSDGSGALLYAGAAGIAYSLGLRHAFDADHISAIDDSTRFLLQKGRRPLGVGLAFSLGHSTVVFALAVGVALAAQAAAKFSEGFSETGGIIGTAVSGTFLYLIAGLNLIVLLGIVKVWRAATRGEFEPERLEALLAQRGLLNRLFRGRYDRLIHSTWQLYFVGLLFGLGFDTATQVAALGLAAGAAAGGMLPPLAIIALPLIFAAGMSLMDTLDGIFMSRAYSWSFTNPIRKIYYNLATTGLSIFVAFVVGTIQLVTLFAEQLNLADHQPWRSIAAIDLNRVGVLLVVTFVVTWAGAVLWWKTQRLDERYPLTPAVAGTTRRE